MNSNKRDKRRKHDCTSIHRQRIRVRRIRTTFNTSVCIIIANTVCILAVRRVTVVAFECIHARASRHIGKLIGGRLRHGHSLARQRRLKVAHSVGNQLPIGRRIRRVVAQAVVSSTCARYAAENCVRRIQARWTRIQTSALGCLLDALIQRLSCLLASAWSDQRCTRTWDAI